MTKQSKHNLFFLKAKKIKWIIAIVILLGYLSFYIPVPYYLTMPGSAMELSSLVEVENGYDSKGEFMMTTVSMMRGTLLSYAYSFFNNYMDSIPEEYILNENEDPEDYSRRQLEVMKESQISSIIAAFDLLNKPVEIKEKGILVLGLIEDLPSSKVLQTGDLIIQVDNIPMTNVTELIDYFKTKKEGDLVQLVFIRDNKRITEVVPLVNLSKELDVEGMPSTKPGIGIYPYQEREVATLEKVKFETENIGGPSAGLMFTLEIINQLTAEDLTKGYKIAGTGTINSDGKVGQIGGARFKVKAAYEKGAKIFFVPKDIKADDTNQKDAEKSNDDLGNPLKIIPVSNIKEAVDYLKTLPVKS